MIMPVVKTDYPAAAEGLFMSPPELCARRISRASTWNTPGTVLQISA